MNSCQLIYEFGGFTLDRDERILRSRNVVVPLTPKATEILVVLVERRGHIVEKADLMQLVWPDTAVEESNLTQNIYTLRKVLTDVHGRCPFIETVPRRGYRFVGPVRELNEQPTSATVAERMSNVVSGSTPAGGALPDIGSRTETTAAVSSTEDAPLAPQSSLRLARPWRTHQAMRWLLAATVPAVIGAALFWATDLPRVASKARELTPRLLRITNVGTVVRAAISPDGSSLAYAVSVGARESLWVKRIDSPDAEQLIEPAVGTYYRGGGLTYAPDGWVYYAWFQPDLAWVGVFRIRQEGGRPEPLRNVWDLPSFDPSGTRFACVSTTSTSIRDSRLLVYNAADSSARVLAIRAPPTTFLQMRPAWSADGRQVAAWTMSELTPGVRDLVIVNVDDGRERIVTRQHLAAIDGMVWAPDGSAVIIAARERPSSPLRLWQISLAAPMLRPLTNDVSDYLLAGLTADGRRLAAVRVDIARSLWVAPVSDLSRAQQVGWDAGALGGVESVAWMPDGRLLYTSAESGNADIWMFDPARDKRQQLTSDPHDDFTPASSPDGRTIVFASDRSGASGLWAMSDAGEPSVRQLTKDSDSRPSVSPEGWVVFQRGVIQSAPTSLWRIRLKGGTPDQIDPGTSIRPAVSPDGRYVAYYWLTPERWALALRSLQGREPSQVFDLSSTHCGRTVRWSSDSKALAYIDCEGGAANIWLQPLDGSRARKLTDFKSGQMETFDWSRDGSHLAWVTRTQVSDVVLIDLSTSEPPS